MIHTLFSDWDDYIVVDDECVLVYGAIVRDSVGPYTNGDLIEEVHIYLYSGKIKTCEDDTVTWSGLLNFTITGG